LPSTPTPSSDPLNVDALYRSLSLRLARIVRGDVNAPEAVIEDACQFAWSRLVCHAGRVRQETVLPWLARTAIHEAFKLVRRERRELSLDRGAEAECLTATLVAPHLAPEAIVEYRMRLDVVARLSARQQRMLWLHALGLSYEEIALSTGATTRTVERQLLRAKKSVRRMATG
jgi:RNA polymerase sigma factor (sigma-70 family)